MTNEQTKEKAKEADPVKLKIYVLTLAVVCLILIAAMAVGGYFFVTETNRLSVDIEKCLELTLEKDAQINVATAELEKSKARIAGIKNNDDLLKRDIELYIRHTYKKVPKSVAKTIAVFLVDQSKKEDVSPELMVGIMQVESMFNPMAVGPKTKYGHARGLMQVMPEWAKKFGLDTKYDLHDIDTNITSGIKVFKIHLEEGKGKISEGLYLYVNKDRSYVDKVYNAMGKFVSFRSTVDDDEKSEDSSVETNGNGHGKKDPKIKEKKQKSEPVTGAAKSN